MGSLENCKSACSSHEPCIGLEYSKGGEAGCSSSNVCTLIPTTTNCPAEFTLKQQPSLSPFLAAEDDEITFVEASGGGECTSCYKEIR